MVVDDELRTSAAHVLVDELPSDETPLSLNDADAHHLSRSLRLRAGEVVTATDGAGRWRRFLWRADSLLEPDGPIHTVPRPEPPVTIGFAPVKADRPEWTVQKLTELGVDHIAPLLTDRSVVRLEGARLDRLRRVAREACVQARRCYVPRIDAPVQPTEVAGAALAHFGGDPVSLDRPVILIGPEGGWSDTELSLGLATVSLGSQVLRAETAALSAAVQLVALRERG